MSNPTPNKQRRLIIFLVLTVLLVMTAVIVFPQLQPTSTPEEFDGDRAYADVVAQVEMGPRTPGSSAHEKAQAYIVEELRQAGWTVKTQEGFALGHTAYNLVARRGSGSKWVILGAHYDSRLIADRGGNPTSLAVPGANDGASGVAVLLELARVLPTDLDAETWLVFFDLEDQGHIEDWDWILGSQVFADQLEGKPDAVVVIDMIGDADLNIYREKTSNVELTDEIWGIAAELGYEKYFINSEKYGMLDDHTPFLNAGISAIDIIDFDYPYWHTIEDTADKVSPQSLKTVGDVLTVLLKRLVIEN